MDISNFKFLKTLEQMRKSPEKVPSWLSASGARRQGEIAKRVDRFAEQITAYEDNYGMLKVLREILNGAKDECFSKKPIAELIDAEYAKTKGKIRTYAEFSRNMKLRRWMVGSAKSLLAQLFCRREANSSCLKFPMFSTCRYAWFRLSDNISAYSALAKANALLISPNNTTESDVLYERSTDSFRDNVAVFTHTPGELDIAYMIHGQALVSFGISKGGVPLVLSIECDFDTDGNIDGLDRSTVGYDIIAFRPTNENITRKIPKVLRVDTLTKEG